MDFKTYLASYAKKIDQHLVKMLPKKLTVNFLTKEYGDVRYKLDANALTKAISNPVWNFLDRGGKRWRPVFFLVILDVLGKDPKKFIGFACIFELIHNGTLIVDDLEDSSLTRRGKPTLHLIYGVDIAMNAGNTLYYWPIHLLENYKLSTEIKLKLYQTYIRECICLHLGQGTDIVWHKGLVDDFAITEKEYLQMCAFKTGSLARMASKMAAIVSGVSDKLVEAFGRLGESLGIIFQIQDDILNITPSELSAKKGLGEDITEGKRSLPVIHALKSLPQNKAQRLIKILRLHTTDRKLITEAIDLINQGMGIKKAQKTMEKLFKSSWAELDPLLKNSPKKEMLYKLSRFLIERQI